MASTEFVDPYLDPATGILRNKLAATSHSELDQAEGDLVFARLVQLGNQPLRSESTPNGLRAIHHHLFQDVYPWAGQLRSVDMNKLDGRSFMPVSRLESAANYVFNELKADNCLQGMARRQFVERLAYFYDNLNYLHPFR